MNKGVKSFEAYCREQDEKTRKVDSLDFEDIDGPILQESYKEPERYGKKVQQGTRLVMAIFIGCLIGLIVSAVSISVEKLIESRNSIVEHKIEDNKYGGAWGVMLGLACSLTIIPMILCLMFPAATGSGMPEVISFLNGTSPKRYHTWVTLVVKLIGMIGVVGAGLYSGYDGPIVHVGCLVALTAIKLLKRVSWFRMLYFRESRNMDHGDGSYVRKVKHYREQRFFGAIGTAAAVAAAFRSPLGATVFALEEAVTFFEGQLLLQALVASITSYLVNGVVKASNKNNDAAYSVFQSDVLCNSDAPFLEVFNYIILGCIFGVMGSLFNVVLEQIRRYRARLQRGRPFSALAYLITVIVVTISIVLYAAKRNAGAFGKCTPVNDVFAFANDHPCYIGCDYDNATDTVYSFTYGDATCSDTCVNQESYAIGMRVLEMESSFCLTLPNTTVYPYKSGKLLNVTAAWAQGAFYSSDLKLFMTEKAYDDDFVEYECYYELASLLLMSPEHMVKTLLVRGVYNLFSYQVLLIFFVIYFFISSLTVGLAMPTDLVLPTLIIGSTIGRLYGLLTNVFQNKAGVSLSDPGDYALLGFAGMWAGSARLPVTVTLIALETTFNNDLLPAVVLVTLFATIVGNLLVPSLYEHEIESKGLPYLPAEPSDTLRKLQVKDLMLPAKALKVVEPRERYKTLLAKVRMSEGNGFPLVDSDLLGQSKEFGDLLTRGRVVGLVLRSQLKQKLFGTYKMRSKTQKTVHRAGSAIARVADRIRTPSAMRHRSPSDSSSVAYKVPQKSLSKRFALRRNRLPFLMKWRQDSNNSQRRRSSAVDGKSNRSASPYCTPPLNDSFQTAASADLADTAAMSDCSDLASDGGNSAYAFHGLFSALRPRAHSICSAYLREPVSSSSEEEFREGVNADEELDLRGRDTRRRLSDDMFNQFPNLGANSVNLSSNYLSPNVSNHPRKRQESYNPDSPGYFKRRGSVGGCSKRSVRSLRSVASRRSSKAEISRKRRLRRTSSVLSNGNVALTIPVAALVEGGTASSCLPESAKDLATTEGANAAVKVGDSLLSINSPHQSASSLSGHHLNRHLDEIDRLHYEFEKLPVHHFSNDGASIRLDVYDDEAGSLNCSQSTSSTAESQRCKAEELIDLGESKILLDQSKLSPTSLTPVEPSQPEVKLDLESSAGCPVDVRMTPASPSANGEDYASKAPLKDASSKAKNRSFNPVVYLDSLANRSVTTIRPDMLASKAYSLMRTMGYRHMCVTDKEGYLVGLVTRGCFVAAQRHSEVEADDGASSHSYEDSPYLLIKLYRLVLNFITSRRSSKRHNNQEKVSSEQTEMTSMPRNGGFKENQASLSGSSDDSSPTVQNSNAGSFPYGSATHLSNHKQESITEHSKVLYSTQPESDKAPQIVTIVTSPTEMTSSSKEELHRKTD